MSLGGPDAVFSVARDFQVRVDVALQAGRVPRGLELRENGRKGAKKVESVRVFFQHLFLRNSRAYRLDAGPLA